MPILSGRSTASLLVLGDATVAPYNIVQPYITGPSSVIQGDVLTRNNGTWKGALPITTSPQWTRNGVHIDGATSDTYTIVDADVGKTITCEVTATNHYGSNTSVASNSFIPQPSIPANSVIIYNGADPGLSGWTRYSAADGLYILGTATQSEIATTATNSLSVTSLPLLVSTDGAHNPGSTRSITSSIYSGSISVQSGGTAGAHSHTASITSLSSTAVKPYTTTATLLYNTAAQANFPANTICINGTTVSGRTQKLATSAYRYISGGASGVTDVAPTTASFSGTSGTDGTHDHSGANSGSSSSPGSGVYNAGSFTGQSHSHSFSGTVGFNRLTAKLLKLWTLATASVGNVGDIVMYMGDLSALPSYWKVCDGNNGTVDMTNYFLGYSNLSGTAHGTVTTQTPIVTGSLATNAWTHTHGASTTTGVSSYVTSIPHLSTSVSHTHTLSYSSGGTYSYTPGSIKLAFIQYVLV
jgi:hypothetical protein